MHVTLQIIIHYQKFDDISRNRTTSWVALRIDDGGKEAPQTCYVGVMVLANLVDIDVGLDLKTQSDNVQLSGAMMAHTKVADRFNRHHSGNGDNKELQPRRYRKGGHGGGNGAKRVKFADY